MFRLQCMTFTLISALGIVAAEQDGGVAKKTVSGTQIVVSARNQGSNAIEVVAVVETGQRVKNVDLLIQLNGSHLDAAISERKNASYAAMASAEAFKVELRNAQLQLEAHASESKSKVDLAKLSLVAYEEGVLPMQKLALNLEVLKAEAAATSYASKSQVGSR